MGKLQGIKLTPELSSIVETVLALPQPTLPTKEKEKDDDDKPGILASEGSSSPRSMSASSPSALLEQVQVAKHGLLQSSSFTADEAKSILKDTIQSAQSAHKDGAPSAALPLAGVSAMKYLINNSQSKQEQKDLLIQLLESALSQSTLSFKPKPTPNNDPAFTKRLERLRLQDEERSYNNLTTNLKTASSLKDDNVTAKSMMYATSVGLNMVVAPTTFGVFMYFFAGSIFSKFFDSEETIDMRGNNIDVRRVIAGVVSGVFMLFVEMILFVIRSHELDASVRKKSRRKENRANPFGYTEKNMARVYDRDD